MFSILLLIDDNLQVKVNYIIKFEICPAFIYEPLNNNREGGVLPEKFGGGVRPASQNPYSIIDHQNLQFSLLYDQTKNLTTYLQLLPQTQLPLT